MADPRAMTPLEGLTVIDLSQNLAGPYATQILGDLGADVIKVEPPGGDPARRWGPPFVGDDSPLFQVANRNKRSVTLDLRTPEGMADLWRLVEKADVFVEAFKRGAADRFGFSYEAVSERKPDVIYVSVTAFGEDGPLADRPGYDPLMQARSGIMAMTGDPDGPPARVGVSVVDIGTGVWTAVAVLAALRDRDQTGRGCKITASLMDTALSWMSYHMTGYLATGSAPHRMGSAIGMIAPYEAYPTRDGAVMIAAGNDRLFGRLCEALGTDWIHDERFRTNADRVANRNEMSRIVAAQAVRYTNEELVGLLTQHGVPAAPVNDVAGAVHDDATQATGMLRLVDHPNVAAYYDVPPPIRWDGERSQARRVPPSPGQHQDEVL